MGVRLPGCALGSGQAGPGWCRSLTDAGARMGGQQPEPKTEIILADKY